MREQSIYKHTFNKNISYCHRYVDDVLVCFAGIFRDFEYYKHSDSIFPRIKFTMYIEEHDGKLFFDRGNPLILLLYNGINCHILSSWIL